jgi:hypothetical protein
MPRKCVVEGWTLGLKYISNHVSYLFQIKCPDISNHVSAVSEDNEGEQVRPELAHFI